MQLVFERSVSGRKSDVIEKCDVPMPAIDAEMRSESLRLPELTEGEHARHYGQLAQQVFGVNSGFYPLGSCTMKYNPKLNEAVAALPGFAHIHPLMPDAHSQGVMGALAMASERLAEITGMDHMVFQPAAGAHGEWLGLLLIKKYHEKNGEGQSRTKMIVPETAHGTNPATAVMAGFDVVTITTNEDGGVNLDDLRKEMGSDVAGLMLTNPSTLGLFEKDILEITDMVHQAGGLVYYDGANLNAIMGIVRPGDMGFDVVHLNLHKTFSTPHGGGGPGSGAVGCKAILEPFLPTPVLEKRETGYVWNSDRPDSVGRLKNFYGHTSVVLRALTYILSLGSDGLKAASEQAVLNANYMRVQMKDTYPAAYDRICMHEYVACMTPLKEKTGVSALDLAKGMLDNKLHPPTMYFPLNVHEALMFEPTETESVETMDAAIAIYRQLVDKAHHDADNMHKAPVLTPIRRVDEVGAARNPRIVYEFE